MYISTCEVTVAELPAGSCAAYGWSNCMMRVAGLPAEAAALTVNGSAVSTAPPPGL